MEERGENEHQAKGCLSMIIIMAPTTDVYQQFGHLVPTHVACTFRKALSASTGP